MANRKSRKMKIRKKPKVQKMNDERDWEKQLINIKSKMKENK